MFPLQSLQPALPDLAYSALKGRSASSAIMHQCSARASALRYRAHVVRLELLRHSKIMMHMTSCIYILTSKYSAQPDRDVTLVSSQSPEGHGANEV